MMLKISANHFCGSPESQLVNGSVTVPHTPILAIKIRRRPYLGVVSSLMKERMNVRAINPNWKTWLGS
jgi:hypothetical protein